MLCYLVRFDLPDGRKEFRPLTLHRARGQLRWQWQAPPELRPLYGLDRLAGQPSATVLVCEGEKAADAAAALLPEIAVIASMNGARSPAKSDRTPLAGREVRIWPDADEAGTKYAEEVVDLATAADATSVEVLDVAALWGEVRDDGSDAADWPEGAPLPDPLPTVVTPAPAADKSTASTSTDIQPYYYMLHRDGRVTGGKGRHEERHASPEGSATRIAMPPGLYHVDVQRHPERPPLYLPPLWVSQDFELLASVDDGVGHGYGLAMRFEALHGHLHTWTLPRALLVVEGREHTKSSTTWASRCRSRPGWRTCANT